MSLLTPTQFKQELDSKILYSGLTFTTWLECSELFTYIYSLADNTAELEAKNIPKEFSKYLVEYIIKQFPSLVEKIEIYLDNKESELRNQLDDDIYNVTNERGAFGNLYISDWTESSEYSDNLRKFEFVKNVYQIFLDL
jgi:hypothetical protein